MRLVYNTVLKPMVNVAGFMKVAKAMMAQGIV